MPGMIEVKHWSGAGNRFVVIDSRKLSIEHQWSSLITSLCQRPNLPKAEGVIILQEIDQTKSKCYYEFYNPDGSTGMMCGNGARCAVRFAMISANFPTNEIELILNGRSYKATMYPNDRVALRFPLFKELRSVESWSYVNVGSHHIVINARDLVDSIDQFHQFDLIKYANENLNYYRDKVQIAHLNLNLAYLVNDSTMIHLRTYENGVFDETQGCGTGALSTAIVFWTRNFVRSTRIQLMPISQRLLTVHLEIDDNEKISGTVLEGDAQEDAPASLFDTVSMTYQ